jgi:hypothetical protein
MYNIHSHYENIFNWLKTIVTHRRVMYLLPYGSTQPENLECLTDNLDELEKEMTSGGRFPTLEEGPFFIFYDQEPIYGEYNYKLFDHIQHNYIGPYILISTEKNSKQLDAISKRYMWPTVYYFHHIFAAHDWFRGSALDKALVAPADRKLKKKYITFNRLTSSARVYRSLFISELIKRNILDQGYVSYNDVCPDGGSYKENLLDGVNKGLYPESLANDAIENISKVPLPLRIDYKDREFIPNSSFKLSATAQTQESFVYVVTETCYWEEKCHLTEKIFKPIVSRMPFILVGCAHNLEYLRSYGFKTFGQWWDESYDEIEDPILRMQAIGDVLEEISSYSLEELEIMLTEMIPVLEHNYNLFNSQELLDTAWNEFETNIKAVLGSKDELMHTYLRPYYRTIGGLNLPKLD